MKKNLILFILVAFSCTAGAVTFKWSVGTGGVVTSPNLGTEVANLMTSYTCTLYYLGSSTDYTGVLDGTASSLTTKTGLSFPPGRIQDETQTLSVVNPTDANGMKYIAVLTTTYNGVEYINVSGILELSGYTNGTENPDFILNFDFDTITENEWLGVPGYLDQPGKYQDQATHGGGWYANPYAPGIPVPEPATAGLAFAGLALLFRRKRK